MSEVRRNQRRQQRSIVTRFETPADFLNAIREKHGLRSDYQAAAWLDVSQQAVSRYRKGAARFDADVCRAVAKLLDFPYEFVLAQMAEFRAPSEEERAAWRRASDLIRQAMAAATKTGFKLLAATAISAASSGGFNNNAIANPSSAPSPIEETSAGRNTHCATTRRRRGWCTWLGLAQLAAAM